MPRRDKSMETRSRLELPRAEEEGERDREWLLISTGFYFILLFLEGEDEMFSNLLVVMIAQLCEIHYKIHWFVHFKWVNFMICEYFNITVNNKDSGVSSPGYHILLTMTIFLKLCLILSLVEVDYYFCFY